MNLSILYSLITSSFLLIGCYDQSLAEKAAKDFAKNIPKATGNVTCVSSDSDQDGYCSCTLFMKKGPPMTIDCGCRKYGFNSPRGCKQQIQKFHIKRR